LNFVIHGSCLWLARWSRRNELYISVRKETNIGSNPIQVDDFLQNDRELSNHHLSYKTENISDCGMKYLSHYREEDDLRMLVGKVQIKTQGVRRTFKNTPLI